jgi:hypothetical protein
VNTQETTSFEQNSHDLLPYRTAFQTCKSRVVNVMHLGNVSLKFNNKMQFRNRVIALGSWVDGHTIESYSCQNFLLLVIVNTKNTITINTITGGGDSSSTLF